MFRTTAVNNQVVAGVKIAKAINLYATSVYTICATPNKIAEGAGKKRSDCIPHRSALFLLDGWVRIGRIIRKGKVKASGSSILPGCDATSGTLGRSPCPFERMETSSPKATEKQPQRHRPRQPRAVRPKSVLMKSGSGITPTLPRSSQSASQQVAMVGSS